MMEMKGFNNYKKRSRTIIAHTSKIHTDFFTDRLCHSVTTKLILFFVLVLSAKRLYTSPINCWVPKELNRYEKFINRFCWIKGTSYARQSYDEDERVFIVESSDRPLLYYYQWVILFLLAQAALFYVPRALWTLLSLHVLNFDLTNMCTAMTKLNRPNSNISSDDLRNNVFKYMKANLILNNRTADKTRGIIEQLRIDVGNGSVFTTSIVGLRKCKLLLAYIFVKLVYLQVACAQLLLMNYFLNSNDHLLIPSYGHDLIRRIVSGEADFANRTDSVVFPKLSVCDLMIREKDSVSHHYSFNCVLSLNLFNERVFGILWFWIGLVLIPVCLIDFVVLVFQLVFFQAKMNRSFVKSRLLISNRDDNKDEAEVALVRVFANFYLSSDHVFVLRLLEVNSGVIEVSEFLQSLWTEFRYEFFRFRN
jgi:hypothetical protein